MNLAEISVGSRHRKDLGDIGRLCQSIQRVGLLHPIVVTPEGELIAGLRRLEACKRLGWTEIPTRIVDLDDLLIAERDENTVRKDFTPTEAATIGRAIEEMERPMAKERQQIHGGTAPGRNTSPQIGEVSREARRQRESAFVAASAVGLSVDSYNRARQVTEAAERDPAHYGDLAERMDAESNIFGPWVELKRRQSPAAKPSVPLGGTKRSTIPDRKRLVRLGHALAGWRIGLEGMLPGDYDDELEVIATEAKAIARAALALRKGRVLA